MKTIFRFLRDCSLALSLMLFLSVPMAQAQTSLDAGDADFLRSLEGNMIIDVDGGTDTYEEVEDQFVNTLKDHIEEFNIGEENSYLMEYYRIEDLSAHLRIATSISNAIDRFIEDTRAITVDPITAVGDFSQAEMDFLRACDSLMAFDFEVIKTNADLENFLHEILDIHRAEFDETSSQSAEDYLYEYTSCPRIFPTDVIRLQSYFENAAGKIAARILSGDLTLAEMEVLRQCSSLMSFEDVGSIGGLENQLVETLKIHTQEFDASSRDASDRYLHEYTGCVRPFPTSYKRLEDTFVRAVDVFMGVAVAVDGGDVECPNCDELKKQLKALEAEYEAKAEEARDAAEKFHNLKKQLSDALGNVIENVDGCQNNRNADLGGATSTASGLVYGSEFACDSNAAVERMTDALNDFWRNHRGSDLENDINEAKEALDQYQKELRELTEKIKEAKKKLDECLEKVRAIEECLELLDALLGGLGVVVPQFSFEFPTPVEFEISFEEHNILKGIEFAENFREVASATLDIDRFSDVLGRTERVRRAIRDLSNRVPIFMGNEGGETFGTDEISARAIIATVLFRIGKHAKLPGYTNIVIDYNLRPKDVPEGIWYEDAMIHAIMMGIFIPQNDNVRPGDAVNWAELMTIIRRWANFTPISPDVEPYPGVAVGQWYTQEIHTLKRLGLLDDFTALTPAGLPKKFELVLVVHRLIGLSGIFLEELAEDVEG